MTIVRGYIVPSIQPRTGSTNPPLITTASLPPAEVGAAYSFQMAAVNGVPPYTWSITASSPDTTMAITPAGLIQWTPQAIANPTETVNIRVTDSVAAPTAPTQFSLTVYPQLVITTSSLPAAQAGTNYSATLTATGGLAPYTWSITGQDGAGFPALNTATGALSGTPTTGETLTITAKVTDSLGVSVSQAFQLVVQAVVGGVSPQRIFVGNVSDASVRLALWPPFTGGNANSYNFYRKNPDNSVIKIASNVVPISSASQPVPQVVTTDSPTNNLLPSTTYTYWGTANFGTTESPASPTIQVTTLAPGPGSTLPTQPTDPATFITAAPANYSGFTFYNNSNTTPLTTTAQVQAAMASGTGAQPGQVVVLQAGTVFAGSSGNPAFTVACSGTATKPIIFTTSADPALGTGGGFVPYSVQTQPDYVPFQLATLPPASVLASPIAYATGGATLSATLAAPWTGRSGYYPVIFYTNNPANFEQRLVHFISGSSAISWEIGKLGFGGGLIGACTSLTILVFQTNWATWDDVPQMATLRYNFAGNGGNGMLITGNYVRLIGIGVIPLPNQTPAQVGFNTLTIGTGCTNVTLDRCVVGNDTGQSGWSPMIRGIQDGGSNTYIHQCSGLGYSFGMPTYLTPNTGQDCQAVWINENGPHCYDNNTFEALAQSIFVGGGSYVPENNIPHDITVRWNYLFKNGAWNEVEFATYAKNLMESKCSQRVAVYGNTFQNCCEAYGTAGQRGLGMNLGSIDNVASGLNFPISSLSSDANGLVTGQCGPGWGTGCVVGQQITCVISNVTTTAYNGTVLVTITAVGSDGSRTFQYQLASNPGASGANKGQITKTDVMCCPWMQVVDWDIHDNQFYGVAAVIDMHCDEGQQLCGHNARMRFANNFCWPNPGITGILRIGATFTALPTSTGGTINSFNTYGHVQATFPYQTLNIGTVGGEIDLLDVNGHVVQTIASTGGGLKITNAGVATWNSVTINAAATVNAVIRTHEGLSNVYGYIMQPPLPDAIIDHNWFLMAPNATGYMATGASVNTHAAGYFTLGTPVVTARRHTVTNNVFDGTNALQATPVGGAGGYTGSDATALPNVTTAVVWSNNAFILNTSTGWPTPFWNSNSTPPVTYASLVGTFAGNTVFPQSPALLNVTQAPYSADSTTGGPIGSQFQTLQFPLLGAYLIGLAGTGKWQNVAHVGAMDAVVIGTYPQYSALASDVAAMKALNPAMKVVSYQNIIWQTPTSAFAAQEAAVSGNNWYLRSTYPSGGIVIQSGSNSYNFLQQRLSNSSNPPSGLTFNQWMAQWNVGWNTAKAPGLDGLFTDNFLNSSRVNADYLETGTASTGCAFGSTTCSVAQQFRNAYADYNTQLRAAMGAQYMHWGNVGDWLPGLPITGYNQILNGSVMEHAIPDQEAASFGGSWSFLMSYYKNVMNAMAQFNGQGPYPIFMHDETTTTNYQAMRYGLGSCLLDNGYYSYNIQDGATIPFFDEFNFNLGSAIAGPNNPTNGTYSNGGVTVWKAQGPSGVWRRDFQNGIVLVNPRGNGAQTVTLETTYWHLRGTQAPTINNAQPTTSVTLADRDGIILSRTAT